MQTAETYDTATIEFVGLTRHVFGKYATFVLKSIYYSRIIRGLYEIRRSSNPAPRNLRQMPWTRRMHNYTYSAESNVSTLPGLPLKH